MKTIELEKGEKIKIIGQKEAFIILENVNGEIFNRTDWNRENEKNKKTSA